MKKIDISEFASILGDTLKKHSPEILAGLGVAGFISATVFAVKATPKAEELISEKKEELKVEKLPALETVKTVWKPYAPTVILTFSSSLCIFGSVSTSLKQKAAIATAYELSEKFAREYKNAVIQTVGEKKEGKIRDNMAQNIVNDNPPEQSVNIYMPKDDGVYRALYFEPIIGNYFWETPARFEEAVRKFHKELETEDSCTVYRWFSFLPKELLEGYPDGAISRYMDLGWESRFITSDNVSIAYKPTKISEGKYDGFPCNLIEYSEEPDSIYRYR